MIALEMRKELVAADGPMWLDLALAVTGGGILLALAVRHGLGSRWTMALLVLG